MQSRQDEISPGVKAFIAGHIDSIVQLETLLMLHASPARDWTAQDVARDLRIDPDWAQGQLDALSQQGMLVRGESTGVRQYRYGPAAAQQRTEIEGLARAYAERRVTVIGLIFSKPADSLRAFSDAFRLRKDKGTDRG